MAQLKIELPSATLEMDKKLVRKVLRQVGQEIAGTARALIRRSKGSGAIYGSHQASAPGQPPASNTGNLAGSIGVKAGRGGLSVSVKDAAFYALFLEAGAKGGGGRKGNRNKRGKASSTRVLEPRPFLSVALDKTAPNIDERVKEAILKGVSFKTTKR